MFYLVPLGLLLVFIFALGARSLELFSRHKLEAFCDRRGAQKKLSVILKQYENAASAVSLARILSLVLLLFIFCLFSLPNFGDVYARTGSAILILFLIVVFEFWLPRSFAKLWSTYFVYFGWFVWHNTARLMSPLLFIDRLVTLFFCRLADYTENEDAFEEEIRIIVTEGHREGLLEEDAREMIEGVIELRGVTVSEIMTPRTDMRCLSETLSWEEMLQFVLSTSHSRIPVYKETRDDVVGVIHTKDLLRELAQNTSENRRDWTDLMTEPLFIPETKPVDALLQEFQNVQQTKNESEEKAKGHLAIVLDEYGGVAGIVTLEDILEEIVGDITDEHDTIVATKLIEKLSEDTFAALGKVRIDELNEQLDLYLPEEEDYDTVAGFIFSTLGHIPEVGESVDYEHEGKKVRLTVLDVTRRRIGKVKIERNC